MGKYGGGGHSSAAAKQDAQVRDARHNVEQQGGFDWTPVVLLGVMGATALFSFDRAYQKHTQRKEEEDEREKKEEERKQQQPRRRRRDEDGDRRVARRRGGSEDREGRSRTLDDWSDLEGEREVDENGFYVARARRGRSRGSGSGYYDRGYYDRDYDRGYSVDYHDRYRGGSRRGQSTW